MTSPQKIVDSSNNDQSLPLNPLVEEARTSLRQAIDRYIPQLKMTRIDAQEMSRQAAVKTGIDQLTTLMNKLDSSLLRVAVFGLVSRGKSAVINALMGEKVLETGPLNGVTQWPRSVYWVLDQESFKTTKEPLKLELIDTPGLDEIAGEARGEVAQAVAEQADLILFGFRRCYPNRVLGFTTAICHP